MDMNDAQSHSIPGPDRPSDSTDGPDSVNEKLERIERRLERLESSIGRLTQVLDAAPMMVASFTDVADSHIRDAAGDGVDVDARLRQVARLAAKATQPEVLEALETLTEHGDDLVRVVELLDDIPASFATIVDVIDASIARAAERGIDVVELGRVLASGSSNFARFIQGPEFQALVESGVLDPVAIQTVGQVGEALASTKADGQTQGVGFFGLMGAMRDDDVQRALGFAVEFGRRFGRALENGQKQLPE